LPTTTTAEPATTIREQPDASALSPLLGERVRVRADVNPSIEPNLRALCHSRKIQSCTFGQRNLSWPCSKAGQEERRDSEHETEETGQIQENRPEAEGKTRHLSENPPRPKAVQATAWVRTSTFRRFSPPKPETQNPKSETKGRPQTPRDPFRRRPPRRCAFGSRQTLRLGRNRSPRAVHRLG